MAGKSAKKYTKTEDRAMCSLKEEAVRIFAADFDPERASLIRDISNKWVNGTTLHYYFFESNLLKGTKRQRDVVENAFKTWKDLGIGLEFERVSSAAEAEIRIGFKSGDGAWSYIGRYILNIGVSERTMNFGWVLDGQDGLDTALHEIGHTLGFPHEHQNPNAGIEWDEEQVYAKLRRPPNNWSRQKTFHNIIRKLDPGGVEGSDWDPQSIMHYPFASPLIDAPEPWSSQGVPNPEGLSNTDKEKIRQFYPPIEDDKLPQIRPFEVERLHLEPADQADFAILPDATRNYSFATFGESDVVMVLFEDRDGALTYVTADDDSGSGFNAKFRVRLRAGQRYILRLRLYYRKAFGDTAIMMW